MTHTAENKNSPDENLNDTHGEVPESPTNADTPDSDTGANDPVTLLTQERDDMRDKLMRALAEAENTRKRAERTASDTTKYAVTAFAKDMLDIADNLRRALDAIPEDQRQDDTTKTLYDGVAATEKIMLSSFEKHGIHKLEPREGKFDPNFHEVMFEAEVPGKNAGEIIQLLDAGYTIHDRLLRPARVGVAKASNGGGTDYTIDTEA